jgi:hypothetical protein
MERLFYYPVLILIFGLGFCFADVLTGSVHDGTDNSGIEGALIKLIPAGPETLSDATGNFTLNTDAPVLSAQAGLEDFKISQTSNGVRIENFNGLVSIQFLNMLGQLNYSSQQVCLGNCFIGAPQNRKASDFGNNTASAPEIIRIKLGEQVRVLKSNSTFNGLAKILASGTLEVSKQGYETKQVAFSWGEPIQVTLFAAVAADPYEDYRNQCINKINAFRATEGKTPYTRWTEKENCSDLSAQKEYQTGSAHSSFQDCGEWAQNLCPRYPSFTSILGNCLDMMWAEGPGEPFSEHGHYINMSSLSYSKVACGFYVDPNSKVWHVQNFK